MEPIPENECDEDRYYQARSEWDRIETLAILDLSPRKEEVKESISNVTNEEMEKFIQQLDLSNQLTRINPEIKKAMSLRRFFKRLFFLDLPPIQSDLLRTERDRVFALALIPFDDGHGTSSQGTNPQDIDEQAADRKETGEKSDLKVSRRFQTRMLFTLYRVLTKCPSSKSIERISPGWESIGFQGRDPGTDFRGVGLLGLYQLVHFVLSDESCDQAMDTFSLSLDPIQSFPFCIMSLNITSLVLQALREGVFNRDINLRACAKDSDTENLGAKNSNAANEGSFMNCFNHYHSLAFKFFHQDWKLNKRTIKDAGFVILNVRKSLKHFMKNWSTVPRHLDEHAFDGGRGQAQTGRSQAQTGSSQTQTGSSQTQTGRSQAQTGRSHFESGWSEFDSGRSQSAGQRLRTMAQSWRMKIKGPKRNSRKKVSEGIGDRLKGSSKDESKSIEDTDITFTDLNLIRVTDSDEETEFKTPELECDGMTYDLKPLSREDLRNERPFTPYDDDSLDGASITKERRLI